MDKFFFNIFQSVEQRKTIFSIIFAVLIGVLSWMASTITFDEDISKLIPTNSKNQTLQRILNTVNFTDKIIVHISLNANGDFSDLVTYANDFCDSISTNHSKYISDIQGKIDDEDALETIDFVYENLPLFLSSNDYEIIRSKLIEDSIHTITKVNYKTLVSPTGFVAKSMIAKDPLGLSFIGLNQLNSLGQTDNFKLKDGFLVSKDERHILLFLTPNESASDSQANEQLSTSLYVLKDELNKHFFDKAQANYFGGPLIAAANAKQIKTDIQLTVSIALTVLLLLFVFFYRKLTIPLILFTPTIFGGILAITILSVIRSEISAISLGIGAVLLGITLDYSLHILTHIRNGESVKSLYKSVTKPILMSSLTTAMAFLCLLFINAQALQDLGIFAAISVIGASLFALLFIPQVYRTQDKNPSTKHTLIDRFANYDFSKSKLSIITIVGCIILSAFTFHKVQFNNNLSQLNYLPKYLEDAETDIDALTNVSSKSLYIVAYGEDSERVLQINDSIFNQLTLLKKAHAILDFNSIGALVSSDKKQANQIKTWQNFWTEQTKTQTQQFLTESGTSFGFKDTSFNEFYELLDKDFSILDIDKFSEASSFPITDFMSLQDDFKTIHSVVKVNENQIAAIKGSFQNNKNIAVIDRQHMNEDLLGDLKTDFNHLVRYSLLLIFVVLLVFYKNFKLTLVTIIPILMSWFLTLGLMGILSLEFNIFNIIISTFIFGLGVDYSIFMTNGLQRQQLNSIGKIATYKTSVILSVITTILGVGVLIFAKHPALQSLAFVSIIGIVSALFITFTIQPLLFKFFIAKPINASQNGEN